MDGDMAVFVAGAREVNQLEERLDVPGLVVNEQAVGKRRCYVTHKQQLFDVKYVIDTCYTKDKHYNAQNFATEIL